MLGHCQSANQLYNNEKFAKIKDYCYLRWARTSTSWGRARTPSSTWPRSGATPSERSSPTAASSTSRAWSSTASPRRPRTSSGTPISAVLRFHGVYLIFHDGSLQAELIMIMIATCFWTRMPIRIPIDFWHNQLPKASRCSTRPIIILRLIIYNFGVKKSTIISNSVTKVLQHGLRFDVVSE